VAECRGQHVVLYTKDRQVSKYQQDGSLHKESPNEYQFNVRIWKSGGSCYAFLVMNGQDATLNVVGTEPEEKVRLLIKYHPV